MTIYAYIHTYTSAEGVEQHTLCTTYAPEFLPKGVQAVEFPDGTPLAVVNGQIRPHYGQDVGKASSKQLSLIKQQSFATIENGFPWNGHQITLSKNDQANNQLSLAIASYAKTNAVPWEPSFQVTPTTVVFANNTYWEPSVLGVTGTTEPTWDAPEISDGSVTWKELQFLVGTTSGNIPVNVIQALELGGFGAKFINSVRISYQQAKSEILALSSLPEWASNTKFTKNSRWHFWIYRASV